MTLKEFMKKWENRDIHYPNLTDEEVKLINDYLMIVGAEES